LNQLAKHCRLIGETEAQAFNQVGLIHLHGDFIQGLRIDLFRFHCLSPGNNKKYPKTNRHSEPQTGAQPSITLGWVKRVEG
jgi:hypothetical protein